jgi:hypothetical protein
MFCLAGKELMKMSDGFVIHTDFQEIFDEIAEFQEVDKKLVDEVTSFVNSLRDLTFKVEPALKLDTEDERQLWKEYRQLQQEKLVRLDLAHEYEFLQEEVKQVNPKLDVLIIDALEELKDHIEVLAETQRAHIDILEIHNTRRIEVLALIITTVISYLAVWEFFVRDLLQTVVFPLSLSPNLNYLLVIITLLPIFAAVVWAWRNRGKRF